MKLSDFMMAPFTIHSNTNQFAARWRSRMLVNKARARERESRKVGGAKDHTFWESERE